MGTLITTLLVYVMVYTGLPAPEARPKISFESEIHYTVTGEPRPKDPYAPRVYAAYDIEKDLILLPHDFDPKDIEDQAMLLHELVHFVQGQAGMTVENTQRCEIEKAAYETQFEFLRDRHRLDLMPSAILVIALTSCY